MMLISITVASPISYPIPLKILISKFGYNPSTCVQSSCTIPVTNTSINAKSLPANEYSHWYNKKPPSIKQCIHTQHVVQVDRDEQVTQ